MNITPNHTKQEEMFQILTNINKDITHKGKTYKVSVTVYELREKSFLGTAQRQVLY